MISSFFSGEGIDLIDCLKEISNLFNAMFIAMNFIGAGDVRAKLPVLFSPSLNVTFLSYDI